MIFNNDNRSILDHDMVNKNLLDALINAYHVFGGEEDLEIKKTAEQAKVLVPIGTEEIKKSIVERQKLAERVKITDEKYAPYVDRIKQYLDTGLADPTKELPTLDRNQPTLSSFVSDIVTKNNASPETFEPDKDDEPSSEKLQQFGNLLKDVKLHIRMKNRLDEKSQIPQQQQEELLSHIETRIRSPDNKQFQIYIDFLEHYGIGTDKIQRLKRLQKLKEAESNSAFKNDIIEQVVLDEAHENTIYRLLGGLPTFSAGMCDTQFKEYLTTLSESPSPTLDYRKYIEVSLLFKDKCQNEATLESFKVFTVIIPQLIMNYLIYGDPNEYTNDFLRYLADSSILERLKKFVNNKPSDKTKYFVIKLLSFIYRNQPVAAENLIKGFDYEFGGGGRRGGLWPQIAWGAMIALASAMVAR